MLPRLCRRTAAACKGVSRCTNESMHRGSHAGAVVLQVLQCSAAEEAETHGIIVAAIDAAHPEGAIHGFQEGRPDVLHLAHPNLDLHVVEEEVSPWLQVPHLQNQQ